MILKEQNNRPPIYGLVLAGGKSLRMGQDKGAMPWHGREQRYYMADMLKELCSEVFISCRTEQQHQIDKAYKTLPDSYEGSGPIIALLSAFLAQPGVAWLVVACDLPLLDKATLHYLLQQRDPGKIATTFASPYDTLPEPLITIWEPSATELLNDHYANGFKCPRKLLIRNEEKIKIITPPDPDDLLNTNTPEDATKVLELLAERQKSKL